MSKLQTAESERGETGVRGASGQLQHWSLKVWKRLIGNVRFRQLAVAGSLVPNDLQENETVKCDLRKAAEQELERRSAHHKVNGFVEIAEKPGENHHSTENRERGNQDNQGQWWWDMSYHMRAVPTAYLIPSVDLVLKLR